MVNERRLIYADQAEAMLKNKSWWLLTNYPGDPCATGISDVIIEITDTLLSVPTVDAVKVIRCDQCKYSDPMEDGSRYCQLVRDCRKPDDFCSRGESREDV